MKVRIIKDRFGGMGWRAEPGVLHLGGVGTAGGGRPPPRMETGTATGGGERVAVEKALAFVDDLYYSSNWYD